MKQKENIMITFISPAKGFNETTEKYTSLPSFQKNTEELVKIIKKLSKEELQKLMKTSEELTELNYERYQNFEQCNTLIPSICAYDGIQYKAIQSDTMTDEEKEFLNNHLRIISGLYGILRPLDGIQPYRLEMQTKIKDEHFKNLYDFWGDALYKELKKHSDGVIVNLASTEYSKGISKYAKKDSDIKYIECVFKVMHNGKEKIMSTASKKARGQMVRFIAENKIDDYRKLKEFNIDGYVYREELSENDETLTFLKN